MMKKYSVLQLKTKVYDQLLRSLYPEITVQNATSGDGIYWDFKHPI